MSGRGAPSLAGESSALRTADQARDIKRLKRHVTLLEQQLREARTARGPRRLPKARTRKYTHGDIVRVTVPDSHGSSIDPAAAGAFLADLKMLAPHEVVLMGDHVDCGGFLAQHHTLCFVAQTDYSYEEDLLAANQFLDEIQARAPRAVFDYLEGNHERRIETWCITETLRHRKDCELLRKALAPEYMLRLKERGITYRRESECYDGLSLPGTIRRGACYFTHGFSTAKNAGDAHLRKIAGNICYAHTHRAQSWITSLTAVGTVAAHNGGCLCRLQPLWRHTDPTQWTHGYSVQFVDRRTGYFFHVNIPIVDGVSMFRPTLSPSYGDAAKRLRTA